MDPGTPSPPSKPWRAAAVVVLPLAALLGWVFWPAFVIMAEKWMTNPQYSHGYLVPLFSLGLLVWKRKELDFAACRTDWRGLVLLVLGAGGYVAGGYWYSDYATAGSFVLAVGGTALLLGGPAALRWAGPAIAFLVFMLPLPYKVETTLGPFLQRVATLWSTWLLQLFGLPAASEGNVIVLEHGRIAVVEACSGLSMLMIFLAISTGMAMVIRRPLVDRLALVVSAIPVALAANVARITANGVAIEIWDVETAHRLFHDQGGWLMMPLAVAMLWVELWVLRRLFAEVPSKPVGPFPPGPAAK